jgi:hypothetical protein
VAEGTLPGPPADEELPPELLVPDPGERHGRFRRGRRGSRPDAPLGRNDGNERVAREPALREPALREPALREPAVREPAPREPSAEPWPTRVPAPAGRTPIPDLSRLAPRSPVGLVFLGTGTFGRWGNDSGE